MPSRRSASPFLSHAGRNPSTSQWRPGYCCTRSCVGADIVIVLGAVLLGLCVGSFLNVCILRLPRDQSLVRPRSTCPNCKQPIAWRDNVPLFSWLWLRGKCRWCHKPISKQYPLIEALVGGVQGFLQALLGAAVGFVLLWLVGMAGTWVFKEEAMGGGDVKMMAMVGSFVGWRGVLLTVFAGAALGSLIFIPLSIKKKRLVPFGVFLAVGAVVAFVFGNAIIAWYGHFLKGD